MRLRIITPLAVVIDDAAVTAVRAEDDSGSFGILAGHADFLTSLAISVLGWTRTDGTRHYCAVRRGMLSVTAGKYVAVATREAIADDRSAIRCKSSRPLIVTSSAPCSSSFSSPTGRR
jgi:F-type H+-transporting ATPase subunit epsilon